MDRYEHFTVVGSSALRMVAKTNGIEQAKENADRATEHIGSLTSSSTLGVDKPINSSGLEQFLTARLRVDQRGIYKPHSHVYRCAVRKMNQQVANCMLVAAHGWTSLPPCGQECVEPSSHAEFSHIPSGRNLKSLNLRQQTLRKN